MQATLFGRLLRTLIRRWCKDWAGGAPAREYFFLSHRHRDANIAEALVRLIETSFYVDASDPEMHVGSPLSVKGWRAYWRSTAKRGSGERRPLPLALLRTKHQGRLRALGLFELGASWGRGVVTFPLLASGMASLDVPAPIGDLHTLTLSDEADCHQLLDDLGDVTGLRRRESSGASVSERIRTLVAAASSLSA